ncbi:hypothetical protein ACVWXO_006970 [Bradyrhizobium sp. LM2.7]
MAAARAKLKPENPLLAEIKWLIDSSDKIADQLDNIGIHMPLMKYTEVDGTFHILPLAPFGNPKAIKMTGRDLVKEYAHYERQIRRMLSYARLSVLFLRRSTAIVGVRRCQSGQS